MALSPLSSSSQEQQQQTKTKTENRKVQVISHSTPPPPSVEERSVQVWEPLWLFPLTGGQGDCSEDHAE